MKLIVEIEKQLGDFLLEVAFETEQGVLALLGASGCGKSMTLKCIAGIETPDRGYIELGGKVLYDSKQHINLPPQERGVGYLFQNYALFPNMTVAQNIGISVPKSKSTQVISNFIKLFQLEGLEKHYPSQLSGGQQQRVALARMLAAEPKVLLLDEPFAALDSYLKWELEQVMLEVMGAFAKPIVFVSHNQEEVDHLATYIGVIQGGKLTEIRPKKEVFASPSTRAEARICGFKNMVRVEQVGEQALYVPEWACTLTQLPPIPEGTHFIALGQDAFMFKKEAWDENVIMCQIVRQIDSLDKMIYVLKPMGIQKMNPQQAVLIYLECSLQKGMPNLLEDRGILGIEPSKVVYLKE
ncbi:MAG: ATP-binding cassette domain-containing protein [Niameybacter sp.]|uniref:sulfate/molybdate ABC transporter ATP-binding protein n=1 Tax=Niameybacter sp. TaxID=2033640 RepID=UPI002FC5DC76